MSECHGSCHTKLQNKQSLTWTWVEIITCLTVCFAQIKNNISDQNHSRFIMASCLWIPDDLWHHSGTASKSPTIQNRALYRYLGFAFFWQELTTSTCMVDCSRTYIYFSDTLQMSRNYEGPKRARSFKYRSLSRRCRLAVLYGNMSPTQMKPLSDTFCQPGNEPRMTILSARFTPQLTNLIFRVFHGPVLFSCMWRAKCHSVVW